MNYNNNISRKGIYSSPLGRTSKKKSAKKHVSQRIKLYSASGQAPAPSKDFFEIVVYNDGIVWRKWRIRYTKNGKVIPSEEKYTTEKFLDSDVVQGDVERYLGDDVIHLALGYLTGSWLAMLPLHILAIITSHLKPKDICNLQQVSIVASKRYRKDEIWKFHLHDEFGIDADVIADRKKSVKKYYIQELKRRKENEIDWDNV